MTSNDLTEVALEVKRDAPESIRLRSRLLPVAPGSTVVAIDEFALTANNFTYARVGDAAQYWTAFPPASPGWGRIPAWGNGTIVMSSTPSLPIGARVYGFVPMASHLVVDADRVRTGWFVDSSTHRTELAPAYQAYRWWTATNPTAGDPMTTALRPALAPVFILSFVLDQALAARHLSDTDQVVVTSASSKAAIGLAHLLRVRHVTTTGVTSPPNAPWCRRLGCYDHVVTYPEIESVAPVATRQHSTVLVDLAGDPSRRAAIASSTGARPRDVVVAGFTRVTGPVDLDDGMTFFAPDHIVALTRQWGRDVFERRLEASFAEFANWCATWLSVERPTTPTEVAATYHRVRTGTQPADQAVLASLATP